MSVCVMFVYQLLSAFSLSHVSLPTLLDNAFPDSPPPCHTKAVYTLFFIQFYDCCLKLSWSEYVREGVYGNSCELISCHGRLEEC